MKFVYDWYAVVNANVDNFVQKNIQKMEFKFVNIG